MRRFAFLFAASLAVIPYPTDAARIIKSLMKTEGTCGRLDALGVDMTVGCLTNVVSTVYSDGRTSLMFGANAPDGSVTLMSFAGRGNEQVKQGRDIVVQPVDGLTVNLAGDVSNEKAVGMCRYGNIYTAASFMTCVAETSEGHYEVRFTPNGATSKSFTLGR